jgi:hypothetical protein
MSNVQACREVGVHRITGTRWRDGRNVVDSGGRAHYYPPIATPPVVISARFLSEDERVLIGDLLRAGQSVRSIAAQLGRSRPRSAGRSAATAARRATIGRSPRTAWRWPAGLGPDRENWPTTSHYEISCRTS